ncbi:sugar transferase [Oribacterium sinus]|jgi:N-acetyllactosaminide 3-alpha-galactosyltransferase
MRNHKDSNQKAWIALILGGCLAGLSLFLSLWKKKSCSSELSGKEKKLCLGNKKASIFPNKKRGNQSSEYRNPFEGKKVIFVENPLEAENADGVRGHLEAVGDSDYIPNFYTRVIKRGGDTILSAFALILLSPVFLFLSIAIFLDDPGPIFFTQKRLGKNKRYFPLHKFRSMKMCTPHDTPTHMLENPEQYITRVGKFLRAHSLDELPQIWDIFVGNMSIIGPRPGLWNQDLLTAERDKYNANDIQPGLSGWAQINGRDSIEIPDKAKLDGEYVEKIGFLMDLRCFFGTIFSVLRKDGVVEGGTGQLKQAGHVDKDKDMSELRSGLKVKQDKQAIRILITGAHSYVGEQVEQYLEEYNQKLYPDYPASKRYVIDTVSLFGEEWKKKDFSCYDVVFHVAGIAHGSVSEKTEQGKRQYFAVNRDLAYHVAQKAKEDGVKQFIFMSTMAVYAGNREEVITEETIPMPVTAYGESKLQAEWLISGLEDRDFSVAILRPPMIYGKGCKGNYNALVKIAKISPIFPKINNQRSMLYIGNLCEFIRLLIEDTAGGIFFPQNKEYVNTSDMVKEIGKAYQKKVHLMPGGRFLIGGMKYIPGGIGKKSGKAFGNLVFDKAMSIYRNHSGEEVNYQVASFESGIRETENR